MQVNRSLILIFIISIIGIILLFNSISFNKFKSNIDYIHTELAQKLDKAKTYNKATPVPLNRLKLVNVSYYDFKGKVHNDGQLIVLDTLAPYIVQIFKSLFQIKFPFDTVKLVSTYYLDKNLPIVNSNNTSSFNTRYIQNTKTLSIHSYGVAIDINPVQNPFIQIDTEKGVAQFDPVIGIQYANRKQIRKNKDFRLGMAEQVLDIFVQNGFNIWGGYWDTPIDYQHFQINRKLAEILILMDSKTADKLFSKHIKYNNKYSQEIINKMHLLLQEKTEKDLTITEFYKSYQALFLRVMNDLNI